jgi:hypothetical protein
MKKEAHSRASFFIAACSISLIRRPKFARNKLGLKKDWDDDSETNPPEYGRIGLINVRHINEL